MHADFSKRYSETPIDEGTGSSSLHDVAREGRAAQAGAHFAGRIDYAAIRRKIGMQEVLTLLEWTPVAAVGPQQRGPCPIHGSASPQSRSLSLNLAKNTFQCFGCGHKGNQLDLFALVTGLPIYRAAIEICRRSGIEPPRPLKYS